MVTTSVFRGVSIPTPAGDVGVWGGELVNQATALDSILGQTVTLPSTTFGSAATLTSSQAQSARVVVNNTQAAGNPFQLNLNSSNFAVGNFEVANNSSGGNILTVTAGTSGTGGTNVVIPAGGQRLVFNDGINITTDNPLLNTPVDVEIILDGGGSVVTSGQHGQIRIPVPMTITGWSIMGDQSGSITFDVYRAAAAVPSSAGSLVGTGTAPNLSTQQYNSSSPVGWTSTTLNSSDWLSVYVSSASAPVNVTRVTFDLACARLD